MVSRRAVSLALLVLGFAISGVVCIGEDGLPRPANFPVAPNATYGATPALADSNGLAVACEWYGWANLLYDFATGSDCLDILRKALTNATVNPPSKLEAYTYYTINRLIDPATNQSYCYEGCFNLGTSMAPSPLGDPLAPPPVAFSSPPAPTPTDASSAPSPLPATPPPVMLTPAASPPAMEPAASPPDASPPDASPPVGDSFPVMEPLPSPPAGLSSPPGDAPSLAPPTSSPPAPPGTTVVNLNGGSIVAPSALLLCFVSGFAVIIVSLAAR